MSGITFITAKRSGFSRILLVTVSLLTASLLHAQEDTAYINKQLTRADGIYSKYTQGSHSDQSLYTQVEVIYTDLYKKYPASFPVNYSLGALYYNEAAFLNDLAERSTGDVKKDAKKKSELYFKKAQPYLDKVNSLLSKPNK
jgi:hypothetical protein